jgi:RHS repeat-associated protein
VSNTRSNDLFSWTGSVAGTTASEVNGLNQIDRHNGVQFSHDAKGNLLSDGTRSYSYTADNRLASGGSTDIYYDPLGRLAHLTGSATDLRYNGAQYIEESDWNGGPTRRRYVHGPGTDEPLVWYEGAGNTDRRYLHADERGSVVAVSDDSGNVLGINKYDEYGVPAATNIGSFGYTGQVWLPELGLWHYKARMYDPKLGRFLQPDPIGYGAGMNMYAYVGGDPVNFNDPSGLRPCAWDEILIVHPQRRVYGSDGVVTSSRRECVTRQWLKENPDFSGGVYGSPVTGGDGGGDTPDQPVTPPVPVPAPLKPCSIRMPNIAFEMDVGVFAGLGGGFKLGLTFDADRGTLTAYRSVRAGYGVGLIAGIGLSLTDDGPSQGWEGSRDNFSMGYGWWGFGVSEPTGTIGDTTVNGGVSFGPKVGVELSRTQSINHRVDLTTEGSSLCQN